MVHKIRRIVSLLLTAVLFTAVFGGYAQNTVETSAAAFPDHTEKASNDRYRLYVNEDTLALIVEDKVTGAYMESAISYDDEKSNKTWFGAMQSAVVITMINGSDDTKQADIIYDDVKKKVSYSKNGFSADIYWTKYKLGLTLEVELTADGLTARVADDSIREDGDKYRFGTIALYPYMGVSYLDTKEGYILVPDGNGALINLNNKEGRYNSGYSSLIYGNDIGFKESSVESLLWDRYKIVNDPEQIIAPVYGIAHTADRIAYLAVVEDGSTRAIIDCMPNGVNVDYNRAYAKFIERKLYTQPTSNNSTTDSLHLSESDRFHSDLQVRFLFLSDGEANYAGMANAYRDYLLKNGGLKKTDDGYRTRVDFLGTDREEFLIGTRAVVMTTVPDIYEITADLKSRGVDDIFSVYKGWQKGGVYDLPISKFKADSKLGGTSKLVQLMKDMRADGTKLYLYDDALRINPDEHNVTFNVVKQINKRKYEEETYKDVYEEFNYVTPARSGVLADAVLKGMSRKDVTGLCVAGITNSMFSYTYSGKTYNRRQCAESYAETLKDAAGRTDLVMEQPFAYLWGSSSAFLDMPLETSSYYYEDEFIPFLSIVLKGVMPVYSEYVNFEANRQEFFLKLVETGTYPSFYITKESPTELINTNSSDIYSSQYGSYAPVIEEYARELGSINELTEGAVIVGHSIDANRVTKVTYSNNVTIYINYSETEQTRDQVVLPAMSYKVVK